MATALFECLMQNYASSDKTVNRDVVESLKKNQ